ncbi:MAG: SAM-dependent methyltransferase, partial [Betaproteobacteria bacterium]
MLNCVCGLSLLTPYRQEIVQKARGLTVEIGIGSSLNRSFYNSSTVETVIGFDPSLDLIKMARAHTNKIPILLSGG